MSQLADTNSDKRIKVCLKSGRSFSVIAGAGSGKTTSLIKALESVKICQGLQLRRHAQRIVCITFTNRGVEVIKSRLKADDLFLVATIHGFLWGEIKNYTHDIKKILKYKLIPLQINDISSKNKKLKNEKILKLNSDLEIIDSVKKFDYDENSHSDYSNGKLNHDDIIEISSLMINEYQNLRKIIGQRYPYIFVDEAQDTFPKVVDALNLISGVNKVPLIGYFGDPMQQIYENRAGNFCGPKGSAIITKKENYRCSKEVVNLLNSFRTDLTQIPVSNNPIGSVGIILVKSEEGKGPRKSYNDEQLEKALAKFDIVISNIGWQKNQSVKKLFLSRQMISRRLGFPKLHNLFTGNYASNSTKENFENGTHFLLTPLSNVLIPLMNAHKSKNKTLIFQTLYQYSPLLKYDSINGSKKIKNVIAQAQDAINALSNIWDNGTIKEILDCGKLYDLIPISERLKENLDRSKRLEAYDDELHSQEKGDWLADEFFSLKIDELNHYVSFLNDETPFSTQHGVKGEEYENVLVFYDDTEASWNNYSFSKLLAPLSSGKEPTEGQKIRSQKLAYVSFSRAEKNLRIILFTQSPLQTKNELISLNLFREDQISIFD